jgi:hypothetical protein
LLPTLLHAQTMPMSMDHHDHMAMPGASRAINGPRNDSLVQVPMGERDSANVLIPALEVAGRAGRRSDYREIVVQIGAKAAEIIATVKQIPTDPASRLFLGRLIDEALSDQAGTGRDP